MNLFRSTARCFRDRGHFESKVNWIALKWHWRLWRQRYHIYVLLVHMSPNFTPFSSMISYFWDIAIFHFLLGHNAESLLNFFSIFSHFKFLTARNNLCGLSQGTPVQSLAEKNHKCRGSSVLTIVFPQNRKCTKWPTNELECCKIKGTPCMFH